MSDRRPHHDEAWSAWLSQRTSSVQLRKEHSDEFLCVLSPEWEAHFRAQAAKRAAELKQKNARLMALMGEVRELKRELEAGPDDLLRQYQALMTNPPQGVFPFSGAQEFLPDTGHVILVDTDGQPILETFRRATGEEHAMAAAIRERQRQLDMFQPSQDGLESQNEAEALPSPVSKAESATAGDSDEMPF